MNGVGDESNDVLEDVQREACNFEIIDWTLLELYPSGYPGEVKSDMLPYGSKVRLLALCYLYSAYGHARYLGTTPSPTYQNSSTFFKTSGE
jgi:hypothetical protein